MNTEGKILVVVHPGSACGSADFNIGFMLAQKYRRALCDRLERWLGGLVILDGELSSELSAYPQLKDALDSTLARASAGGHVAIRTPADDPSQIEVSRRLFKDIDREVGIIVTGAWYHPDDAAGCVNSVADVLQKMGFQYVEIDESALSIDGPRFRAVPAAEPSSAPTAEQPDSSLPRRPRAKA